MKVILQRDIARLGKRGEVKDVAEGYAINVLIKKGDALLATPGEISKWKNKETQAKFKKDTAAASFASLITVLKKEPVVIAGKKADAKGQLFASIKEMDIVDAIFARTKISLDPKQIKLANPIKSIGKHDINLKQGETIETIAVHIQ
jgi:large subunit ribosomal protein L9